MTKSKTVKIVVGDPELSQYEIEMDSESGFEEITIRHGRAFINGLQLSWLKAAIAELERELVI